ncbi:MAG: glycosyl transferase [Marinilabiliaceae bacterium]
MFRRKPTILFLLPVAFVQKPDEPGFQVQTRNFRTALGFLTPELYERGLQVALVSFNNTRKQVRYGRNHLLDSGLQTFLFHRKMRRGHWFPQSVQFLMNLACLVYVLLKVRPGLVYGHNDVGALFGGLLKPFFKYRLVYDMRGDRVNEMEVQQAAKWRIAFYSRIQKFCKNSCDLVFTVSGQIDKLPSGKQHVTKFNFFDARVFDYHADEAEQTRRDLGLQNRFVLVYSGTDKYYQMVPGMVAFFVRFLAFCPDAFLMINTPLPSSVFAEELRRQQVPESSYGMFQPGQENLNRYQMAADMALLLRDDLPLNHRAFPTKFSEYLGSGLPVLVTPYVPAIAEMVTKHHLGAVWDLHEPMEAIFPQILAYRNNRSAKLRCASFAREHLSWQANAPRVAGILKSMCP